MIKDVFFNKELNLYKKIEKFENIKNLSKDDNARNEFKIKIIDDYLCLSIGEIGFRHVFTKEGDMIELEKIKKIQEDFLHTKSIENDGFDSDKLFEYIILAIINDKNTYHFDEHGMLNVDLFDKEKIKTNVMNSILNEIKNKINTEVVDKSIFYSDKIKNIEKCIEKLEINSNQFMMELSNTFKTDEKHIKNRNNERSSVLNEITNTLQKDLLRMDYRLFDQPLVDRNTLNLKINEITENKGKEREKEIESLKLNMMNESLEKIQKVFEDVPIDKKIIIYNLMSQGVFQIVKDSFHGIDPLILLGISPIRGKSIVMINKDEHDNLTITVSNKKTLNDKDDLGEKNAENFFYNYISKGLEPYTKNKVNLLHFLCDNAPNKPSNLNEVLDILDKNKVYSDLDPSENLPLLEEEIQLVFTYHVKDKSINVEPHKSYYEYSYLNI
ncbi:hypothetical protein [Pseudomonas sp. FME51]|uniref:hypothetical protein n=1 Tax=Pseudomonas sp. FME51 TaxID=2742609 RepID=UPI0018661593|nr:hypothetical protein [Pseudomonas sp. FME51]